MARRLPGGGTLGEAVAPLVASVAVMGYRIDRSAIVRLAQPWLAWGERHRRAVRIAREAGRMPDFPRRHYRPATSGELAHLVVGDVDVLLQLNAGFRVSEEGTFAFSHRSTFRGASLTFHGDAERLRALLPQLERDLARYRAFAGLALHEVP